MGFIEQSTSKYIGGPYTLVSHYEMARHAPPGPILLAADIHAMAHTTEQNRLWFLQIQRQLHQKHRRKCGIFSGTKRKGRNHGNES